MVLFLTAIVLLMIVSIRIAKLSTILALFRQQPQSRQTTTTIHKQRRAGQRVWCCFWCPPPPLSFSFSPAHVSPFFRFGRSGKDFFFVGIGVDLVLGGFFVPVARFSWVCQIVKRKQSGGNSGKQALIQHSIFLMDLERKWGLKSFCVTHLSGFPRCVPYCRCTFFGKRPVGSCSFSSSRIRWIRRYRYQRLHWHNRQYRDDPFFPSYSIFAI